jgi:acetate kinase
MVQGVHRLSPFDPERLLEEMAKNEPLISPDAARGRVGVIRTDEELMIARTVTRLLNLDSIRES